jgi:hypothetical protein
MPGLVISPFHQTDTHRLIYHNEPLFKNLPKPFSIYTSSKRKWRKQVSHDDALLSSIHLSVLIDAGHEFVVALLGLDFIWEPLLKESGHFVVKVVWSNISSLLNLFLLSVEIPEFASVTVLSLQNGQLCCLLFCMTIKHLIQNTCPHPSLTGRHLISMHIGHE